MDTQNRHQRYQQSEKGKKSGKECRERYRLTESYKQKNYENGKKWRENNQDRYNELQREFRAKQRALKPPKPEKIIKEPRVKKSYINQSRDKLTPEELEIKRSYFRDYYHRNKPPSIRVKMSDEERVAKKHEYYLKTKDIVKKTMPQVTKKPKVEKPRKVVKIEHKKEEEVEVKARSIEVRKFTLREQEMIDAFLAKQQAKETK